MPEFPKTERSPSPTERLRAMIAQINKQWPKVAPDQAVLEQCQRSEKTVEILVELLALQMKTPQGVRPEIVVAYARYAETLLAGDK